MLWSNTERARKASKIIIIPTLEIQTIAESKIFNKATLSPELANKMKDGKKRKNIDCAPRF